MEFKVNYGKDFFILTIIASIGIFAILILLTYILLVTKGMEQIYILLSIILIIVFYAYMLALCPLRYHLSQDKLIIKHIIGKTIWNISNGSKASVVSDLFKKSYRISANGGIFAFAGLYKVSSGNEINVYSATLYTGVLISTPHNKLYFISPAIPDIFVEKFNKMQNKND